MSKKRNSNRIQDSQKDLMFSENQSRASQEYINFIFERSESLQKSPNPYPVTANLSKISKNQIFPLRVLNTNTNLEIESNHTEPDTEIGAFVLNELEDDQPKGIEDARKTRFLYQKLNVSELSCLVFSLMGLGLAIMSYDIDFVQATGFTELQITLKSEEINTVKTILQALAMISTGFLYVLIFIRYKLRLKWMIAKRFVPKKATLISTGRIHYLVFEWILISLLPTPFYSDISFKTYNDSEKVETTYHVNDLMSLLVLLRVFVVFRIFLSNSKYYTNVAHRICSLTGVKSGSSYIYVMKCIMKNSPLEILFTAMLLYIITFAYAIKVCERPLIFAIIQKNKDDPSFTPPVPNDVSNYYNAMWLMIVTMATIGYGDFFPRTLPGRAITFFSCICGVITVSLLTITLQNLMEMSNAESRSFNIIEKLILKKRKQKHAAFILTNLTRLGFWGGMVNKEITEEQKTYHIRQIKKHLNKFRILRRDDKSSLFGGSTLYEEVSRHFVFLREDYRNLEGKLNILAESNLSLLDQLGIISENDNSQMINSFKEGKSPLYSPNMKRMRYKNASPQKNVTASRPLL